MSLKITEVKSPVELDRFIRLPWKIYKDHPCWVPPLVSERKQFLNPKINPFFDRAEVKLFLAEDEKGTPLGRIALVNDHVYQESYSKNTGIMGMFESVMIKMSHDYYSIMLKSGARKGNLKNSSGR
tara:strand:+ start:252 stop:629 length:378 start_codon:yes stop_codon:yes gene_type:complete